MPNLTLLTTLFLLLFSLAASASTRTSNPFGPDERRAIDLEMQDLSTLESLVETDGLTLEMLQKNGATNLLCLNDEKDLSLSIVDCVAPERERFLDLPGFFWGFCCCIAGVFFVYGNVDDPVSRKKEGRQALIGCLTGALLYLLLYAWVTITAY